MSVVTTRWIVDPDVKFHVMTEDGHAVADCDLDFSSLNAEEQEENARLIAAAPELLELLTMVRDADEDCIRDHLTRMPPTARKLIDDAIAKATGSKA